MRIKFPSPRTTITKEIDMSAAKKVSWQQMTPPTTVIQIRKYLDACQAWFIQIDEDEEPTALIYNQPWKFDTHHVDDTLGLLEEDVKLMKTANCALCKIHCGDAWKVGIANPFTHAQFMVLCTKCKGE